MQTYEMSTNGNHSSSDWENGQLNTPKRSRLYSLNPISIDNPNREGLISYVCRLAEAHSVSPGVLIKQEILPSFRKRYTVGSKAIYQILDDGMEKTVTQISKPIYKKNVNERGFLSFQYIEGLQPLVFVNNLQLLVFSFQTKQTRQNKNLASSFRRWCPKCFQASLDSRVDVYEPLIWSIDAVKICPIHRYPLQNRCPHCGKTQRPLTNKMQVGRCSQCFGWLDNIPNENTFRDLDWHRFVSETISIALTNEHSFVPTNLRGAILATLTEWTQQRKTIPTGTPSFREQRSLLEALLH